MNQDNLNQYTIKYLHIDVNMLNLKLLISSSATTIRWSKLSHTASEIGSFIYSILNSFEFRLELICIYLSYLLYSVWILSFKKGGITCHLYEGILVLRNKNQVTIINSFYGSLSVHDFKGGVIL